MDLTPRDEDFPDYGPTIIGVSLSLCIFAGILVAIRLVHRLRARAFGWDDATIAISVVLSIGHSITDVFCELGTERSL